MQPLSISPDSLGSHPGNRRMTGDYAGFRGGGTSTVSPSAKEARMEIGCPSWRAKGGISTAPGCSTRADHTTFLVSRSNASSRIGKHSRGKFTNAGGLVFIRPPVRLRLRAISSVSGGRVLWRAGAVLRPTYLILAPLPVFGKTFCFGPVSAWQLRRLATLWWSSPSMSLCENSHLESPCMDPRLRGDNRIHTRKLR